MTPTPATRPDLAPLPSVLLLAGGPDAEHSVSLQSAAGIAAALRDEGAEVHQVVIDRPTPDEISILPGDVIFPALHGSYGEGGPLQDLLESLDRPFVGSGAHTSRTAMDKLATKILAAGLGIATKPGLVLHVGDPACPLDLPVVVKPVHDGSSVGLHLCPDEESWARAHAAVAREASGPSGRAYMVEPMVSGREITVGVVGGADGLVALPMIEIVPSDGVYDFAAKYDRDDTRYVVEPKLAGSVADRCKRASVSLARALGARDLCRVDFFLDEDDEPWLLEVNTMPGFTPHSLFPMAAAASGLEMPALCAQLVRAAAGRFERV